MQYETNSSQIKSILKTVFMKSLYFLVRIFYTEKDSLRTKNLKRYLGFVTFLCQLYVNMRLKQGTTLDALVNPIFDCLELSIGAEECSDDELETIALQVSFVVWKHERLKLMILEKKCCVMLILTPMNMFSILLNAHETDFHYLKD